MSSASPTRDHDLRDRLDDLESRVAALESPNRPTTASAPDLPGAEVEAFWALQGLQRRLDERRSAAGEVMIVGALTLPGGAPVSWQYSAEADALRESDWSEAAGAFAALGQPVRLEIVRQILNGVQTTAGLAQIDALGTTGQLHHHLRQLVAAGWVRQSARGSYEVPATRVVPLLACLTGAQR